MSDLNTFTKASSKNCEKTIEDNIKMVQARKRAYLVPWMRLYLWELKFSIIWIHALYLLPGWSSQNLEEVFNK